MSLARIFLYLCLAFIGGVFLNSLILVPQLFILGFFVLGLAISSIFFKKNMWDVGRPTYNKRIVVAGLCLLIFALGIYRHQMLQQPEDNLEYYKLQYEEEADVGRPTSYISSFKSRLKYSLDSSLSPPHSSILGAMMLGEKERLSYELKEKLNRSGTRHITAISGMHVIILANILIGLGLILGLWRGQAFYFALIIIILFIIMVGAPPSAIRAGIMGAIVLFAEKVGRLSQAQRLLIIAATLMLAFNPLLLRFDVGFQLSFLATLGIAKISPYLREKLTFIPKFFEMRNTVSMTIPAVIFTAPILASNFGQLSFVSIFTNILIIPVLVLVLGLGFFAGILGIISEALGQIAFWPVWLLLSYVYTIIDLSSRLPFAAIQIETFPWYLVVLYFALLYWTIKYFRLER